MIENASSARNSHLQKIISGLIAVSDFTSADDLIESGFVVRSSQEFLSEDGRKIFVSEYIKHTQKVVFIQMTEDSTSGILAPEIHVLATAPWEKLME
jgi:hypothetical protein